ncbi:MAG: hypothetical protein JXB10_05985 [Pirellulales bacterium]|nr:hypothetical protein [Pirellulales bacterium]
MTFLAGCGDGRPARVTVSGRVLIDGQPLKQGFVQVVPKGHRPACGKLDEEGRFTLSTFDQDDGCVLGKHPASVTSNQSIDNTNLKWFAPKKYASIATSGLEIEVRGERNDVELHLTWKGSGRAGPFVDYNGGK